MSYQPPDRATASVEVMSFERLRAINDRGSQRADFHVLGFVEGGDGVVTVDFARHALTRRSAVWITPGRVHRWDDIAGVTGDLVLFVGTAPVTPSTRRLGETPDLGPLWRVPDGDWPLIALARAHLMAEAAATATAARTELPDILISALIAKLHPPHESASGVDETFRRFRASVEAHFREHHDVEYYARGLGYAPRTLTRAVQRSTGRTAKAFIVDRVVLEAKRLLVHDRLPAALCAAILGFSDSSNFSVFFERVTGMRPGRWRSEMIAGD